MHEDTAQQWETIGRCLLYTELVHDVYERFEETLYDVAEDILNGEELTEGHLKQLVWMLEEFLHLIRECIVPLIDSGDDWGTVFQLANYPNDLEQ
ncbi:hypothetical protein NP511_22665 (plasmid) [Natrinema thermotolerans]|uniref:Uncharacterized protein n=1 Tax=Natrinema thermotolerans TaxID=121872 RepID=A0AAF0T8H1_9EURY|nr:hypothetical protein [Natrinema thermotolerans]QCC57318.1 hypothetical protein DVR14_01165 [Natrinema thermotolerans]WMT10339.1 hypothetical protein NP511_22665 [Natrinema thermotolerans]